MATPVEGLIKDRLRRDGRLTFAAFMEMALYAPGAGYYTSGEGVVGRDFYTSPAAHPAFGALLGLQLDQMWHLLGQPRPFTVVEVGGGRGLLCRDILTSPFCPPSLEAMRYVVLERGPGAGPWEGLAGPQVVASSGVPFRGVAGCFLCNELWDAFPVHRVAVEGGQLKEVYVALDGDRLAEVRGEPSTPELGRYLEAQGMALAEGFSVAINLELPRWMGQVARALDRGFLLTIDYGGLEPPPSPRGGLICYYRHTAHPDPYVHLGDQDITSPVDFAAALRAGEAAGLATLGLTSQRRFLTNLGLGVLRERLAAAGLPSAEHHAEMMALSELARPGGLGDFLVLAQAKGLDGPSLDGFRPDSATQGGLRAQGRGLPLPRLTPRHTPLLQAKYPHLAWRPPEEV